MATAHSAPARYACCAVTQRRSACCSSISPQRTSTRRRWGCPWPRCRLVCTHAGPTANGYWASMPASGAGKPQGSGAGSRHCAGGRCARCWSGAIGCSAACAPIWHIFRTLTVRRAAATAPVARASARHQAGLAKFRKTGIILAAFFIEHGTPCSIAPLATPRLTATFEEIHNVPRYPDGGAPRRQWPLSRLHRLAA